MSDFEVEPDKIAELEASMRKDSVDPDAGRPVEAEPVLEQQGSGTEDVEATEGAPELGNAPGIDDILATLPEEARASVKAAYDARVGEFQGTFTQKTQELAEQRKAFDGIGSIEEAQEAKEFYDSLRYDRDFAEDIHSQLSDVLDISPEAVQELETELSSETPYTEQADPEMEALRKEISDMREGLADEREQAQYEAEHTALSSRLSTEEAQVRVDHPDWSDDMIETVYNIGSSAGVNIDLNQAAEQLAAVEQSALARYLEGKTGDKPPSLAGGAGDGHIPTPAPQTLDEGHDKARELWRAMKADQAG